MAFNAVYLSEKQLKSQSDEWKIFDEHWDLAWSKERCEKVLCEEINSSDKNVIEYAKMYLKHWNAIEYHKNNKNNRKHRPVTRSMTKAKNNGSDSSIDSSDSDYIPPKPIKKRTKVYSSGNSSGNTNTNNNIEPAFKKRKLNNELNPFQKLAHELIKKDGGCPIHKQEALEFKCIVQATVWLKMYCVKCNHAAIDKIANPNHVYPPTAHIYECKYNNINIKYNKLEKQFQIEKDKNNTLKQSNNEYIQKNNELISKNKELFNENEMCFGRSNKINTLTFSQINEFENKLKNGIEICNQAKERKFECKICLENRANAFILTCKHCVYCIQCEETLSNDKKICAICNGPYSKSNVLKINNW